MLCGRAWQLMNSLCWMHHNISSSVYGGRVSYTGTPKIPHCWSVTREDVGVLDAVAFAMVLDGSLAILEARGSLT